MADHPEAETGDDVQPQDQQRGDSVALHELAGAIHRAVEIGLGRDFAAAGSGFVCRHQAGCEIGVDRHLLAGQGVEGEAGRDFGYAAGALGDDHQVDHHQHQEHEQADGEVVADQECAERLDHMARRSAALVAVDQHDAGGGDVECEAQQGGE